MTDWKKRALDIGGKALKKGGEIAAEKAKEAQAGIAKAAEERRIRKEDEATEKARVAPLSNPERLRHEYEQKDNGSPSLVIISHYNDPIWQLKKYLHGFAYKKTVTCIVLNLETGIVTVRPDGFQMGLGYDAPFSDLSAVELISTPQWTGNEPLTIKNSHGNVVRSEGNCWDIAATNVKTGERILFLRAHCVRDDAFLLTNRLNILLSHAHETLLPWNEKASVEDRVKAWGSPDWGWS